jgi:hypothetical protein
VLTPLLSVTAFSVTNSSVAGSSPVSYGKSFAAVVGSSGGAQTAVRYVTEHVAATSAKTSALVLCVHMLCTAQVRLLILVRLSITALQLWYSARKVLLRCLCGQTSIVTDDIIVTHALCRQCLRATELSSSSSQSV